MMKMVRRFTAVISAAVMMAVCMTVGSHKKVAAAEEMNFDIMVKEISFLVNEARAEEGLKPLYLVPYVCELAELRSAEIVEKFSHTRPNGEKFNTIVDYNKLPYNKISENIAAGCATAEETFEQWKNSPPHWAAIMNPNYTHIGIGITYDPDSYYTWYWTQLFVKIDGDLEGQMLVTQEHIMPVMRMVEEYDIVPAWFGDVNGDGYVNSFDCITLSKYVFGGIAFNDLQIASADVMPDGEINLADIVTLRKYILGEYDTLPVAA